MDAAEVADPKLCLGGGAVAADVHHASGGGAER